MDTKKILRELGVTVIMALLIMVPASLALQGYWVGDAGTPKAGWIGTYDTNDGLPPDTKDTTQAAYLNFTANDPSQKALTLVQRAKRGDVDAINALIDANGGWGSLTAAQKEKVTQLLLRRDVTL